MVESPAKTSYPQPSICLDESDAEDTVQQYPLLPHGQKEDVVSSQTVSEEARSIACVKKGQKSKATGKERGSIPWPHGLDDSQSRLEALRQAYNNGEATKYRRMLLLFIAESRVQKPGDLLAKLEQTISGSPHHDGFEPLILLYTTGIAASNSVEAKSKASATLKNCCKYQFNAESAVRKYPYLVPLGSIHSLAVVEVRPDAARSLLDTLVKLSSKGPLLSFGALLKAPVASQELCTLPNLYREVNAANGSDNGSTASKTINTLEQAEGTRVANCQQLKAPGGSTVGVAKSLGNIATNMCLLELVSRRSASYKERLRSIAKCKAYLSKNRDALGAAQMGKNRPLFEEILENEHITQPSTESYSAHSYDHPELSASKLLGNDAYRKQTRHLLKEITNERADIAGTTLMRQTKLGNWSKLSKSMKQAGGKVSNKQSLQAIDAEVGTISAHYKMWAQKLVYDLSKRAFEHHITSSPDYLGPAKAPAMPKTNPCLNLTLRELSPLEESAELQGQKKSQSNAPLDGSQLHLCLLQAPRPLWKSCKDSESFGSLEKDQASCPYNSPMTLHADTIGYQLTSCSSPQCPKDLIPMPAGSWCHCAPLELDTNKELTSPSLPLSFQWVPGPKALNLFLGGLSGLERAEKNFSTTEFEAQVWVPAVRLDLEP